jgi:head-tail adaptor
MAGAGYRRERMKYQTMTPTVDAAGQQSIAWADVVTLAAVVTPSQREVIDDGGVAVRTDVILESSWHPSVAAKGRLVGVPSGRIFYISSVTEPDGGRNRRLRIVASEVAT